MTRKLSRGRDQSIARDAGEVPVQRVAGMVELLVAGDFGKAVRDLACAVVADQSRHASEREQVLARKRAAKLAFSVWCFTPVRNLIAGEEDPVARSPNAFLSGFKHLGADVARIGPANGLPVFGGRIDRLEGVGKRPP